MTRELAGHGYQISPGTLYPTLHRLEAEGLLTSRQQVVEGRARGASTPRPRRDAPHWPKTAGRWLNSPRGSRLRPVLVVPARILTLDDPREPQGART
nr:PadR family transcriptional regulator [Actinomadura sp. KC06]